MDSTESLKQTISDALDWDSRIDASDILVKVTESDVTLSGEAANYTAYKAAENHVRKITQGKYKVHNQLRIRARSEHEQVIDKELQVIIRSIFLLNKSGGDVWRRIK